LRWYGGGGGGQRESTWSRLLRFVKETTIHPHSKFSRLWDAIVLLVAIIIAYYDPFTACFVDDNTGLYQTRNWVTGSPGQLGLWVAGSQNVTQFHVWSVYSMHTACRD